MSGYVMESSEESERLARQAAADGTLARLQDLRIPAGAKVLDVGCGPGVGTAALAQLVGPTGSVLALDASAERIGAARTRNAGMGWVRCGVGDVRNLDVVPDSFDLAWSQFLFEYLPDRKGPLQQLIRAVRPGGRVVISEIDGTGLYNWPVPEGLEEGMRKVVAALAQTGFDIHVGRKLFGELQAAGLRDVKVRLYPHFVVAGAADASYVEDWRIRLEALRPLAEPRFGSPEAYQAFQRAYLGMLSDPSALKYAVALVTEGTKP